ncbi:carcinoembryonic antigen-related cell adhesion molecule 21-like [Branchiostoma floridae]|uniref:Carcinoembryonic antigen-related cell adhesion molecule 21-like n=1 Tax=Branchiostoma floridae TaxID=7739 RepID=A0A9J7HL62_BRAFL|nr:carcinoembryonic antigen-related cell adhesion molecule 21-like [Branchiostoma floridae]
MIPQNGDVLLFGLVCGFLLSTGLVQASVVYIQTGSTSALSCGVTLTGSLTLRTATWRKQGSPVVVVAEYLIGTSTAGPAYTGRASVNDTGFLLLERVTQADDGMYSCQATLSDFSITEMVEPELQVVDSPGTPTLSMSPNPTCENENQDVQLTCSVASGTTPFTYTFHVVHPAGNRQYAADSV